MICSKCYKPMVEKPLFTSTYWECSRCEAAPRAREFADNDVPETREAMRRYLLERGWIEHQGYLTVVDKETGKPCCFHMRFEEDAIRMQRGRNQGLDNYKAFRAGMPYSWDRKAA